MNSHDAQAMTTMTPTFGDSRPVLNVAIVGLLACAGVFVVALGARTGQLDKTLYALIGLLFLSGVATSVAGAVRARHWAIETEREVDLLETVEDVPDFLRATGDSTTPFRAAVYGMVQASRPGRSAKSDPWLEVMADRLDRLIGPVRWLSGICVLLGVLGTALGAMQSLSGLTTYASSAEVSSGAKMFGELLGVGGPIASLSLAYGSTVLGVLASIILNALAGAVGASLRTYLDHSREIFESYITPNLENGESQVGYEGDQR